MRIVPRSLRGRLVMGAVAVGLVFATAFGVLATVRVHHVEDVAVANALRTRLDVARDEVLPDGSLRPDGGSPRADLVQVIGPDGRVRASSSALQAAPPLLPIADVLAAGRDGARGSRALQRPDVDLATLGVPVRLPGTDGSPPGTGALVVAVDAEGFTAVRSDLVSLLLVGLAAVVLAIAALAWALAGRALRSVTQLTEQAEALRPADMQHGLPVPADDAELRRLVNALNRMLGRLHEGHSREIAFAADAGHRLRTPVATLRAEAELSLRSTDPAEQRAALEQIVQDADRLSSIVDRMLARSRPTGHPSGRPVRDVLTAAALRWQRQAELAGVRLAVRAGPDLDDVVTCAELADILEPVLDNAIRHTAAGGEVAVDARLEAGLVVDVANQGPGIGDDLASHVFDAWVSGRDASVAGGLGLWLARETARDGGGDVLLIDRRPGQTTFRVTLPRA